MATHLIRILLPALMAVTVVSYAATTQPVPAAPPSQDIIIENGYVADPNDTKYNGQNLDGMHNEHDPKTYQDPQVYDYDNVMPHDMGKYDGGIHGPGGARGGGGGGRR